MLPFWLHPICCCFTIRLPHHLIDDRLDGGNPLPASVNGAPQKAEFYVRTAPVPGAPHYRLGDPIDEPGGYAGFNSKR